MNRNGLGILFLKTFGNFLEISKRFGNKVSKTFGFLAQKQLKETKSTSSS